ncbi:MAG: MFS transporter [Chloroflexota bacterium]|nr:MFS transporter [Chloroflexota bacterium]
MLVVVYIFNFVDRNIISILAEDIQRDLGVSDAQLGFMYGTVFAIFYAVFGVPLGRFADVWTRRSLIATGLAFWSAFTALSGMARTFIELTICRMGVGVGEASASPAAFSMLSDYYPPVLRATVIAIYSSGVFIGGGIGLFLGGFLLDTWESIYPIADKAPFGLKGWQVAFMAVGVPGLLLAIWVRTLREPVRGSSEGLVVPPHPAPFSVLGSELKAMTPGLNLIDLKRDGGSVRKNLLYALFILAGVGFLIFLTGTPEQWVALGIGAYITVTWAQSLAVRDPAAYGMVLKSRTFIYLLFGMPATGVVICGMGFWIPPLLLRTEGTNPADVGMYIGLSTAVGGFTGVILGGYLGDVFKRKHPCGRLIIGYLAVAGSLPFGLLTIYASNLFTAAVFNLFFFMFAVSATAIPGATVTDIVMPRMRGVAIAFLILVGTFIGLALGPYLVGYLSDYYSLKGHDDGFSLQLGLTNVYLIYGVTLTFLTLTWHSLPGDEATRLDRARKLEEPVPEDL